MKFKSVIFINLIILQVLIVIFLSVQIYKKSRTALKTISVSPIKKEVIGFNSSGKLKYFYEPTSNTKEVIRPPWLKNKAVYTINSDALNERFNYSVKKPTHIFRIITLGDSFTFGDYVSTEKNYVEQLEDLLNNNKNCSISHRFEVINLGVRGYDIQYSVERFRIRGQKYDPDLVIWFLKDDDFDQINEVTLPIINQYLANLKEKGLFDELSEKGTKETFFKAYQAGINAQQKKYSNESILDYQKKSLEEFNNNYKDQLVVFTFSNIKFEYKSVLKNYVRLHKNAYFFDAISNIHDHNDEFLFPYDYHPSLKGHQIIAQELFNYLINNKIIPCN